MTNCNALYMCSNQQLFSDINTLNISKSCISKQPIITLSIIEVEYVTACNILHLSNHKLL